MAPLTPEPVLPALDIALRLLTALACGTVIGLNREFHNKPAGFRTFGLVSVGSALIVILIHQMEHTGPDAVSRVVQGVVTGIGFIGAGVIFHRGSHVEVQGLTTAAAVWLTAGLGMAAGAGQMKLAWMGFGIGLLLLLVGGPIERLLTRALRRLTGKPTRHERRVGATPRPPHAHRDEVQR
ncbi:MAG: MgtC/SapB family protein [Steroidobacteraceae bacterium]|nr:MgtC/SapB family protein [Steroidobacteraceae bacterium]